MAQAEAPVSAVVFAHAVAGNNCRPRNGPAPRARSQGFSAGGAPAGTAGIHGTCRRAGISLTAASGNSTPRELMAGMRDAVKRLRRALEQREKILIYGDYDVDGTMAVFCRGFTAPMFMSSGGIWFCHGDASPVGRSFALRPGGGEASSPFCLLRAAWVFHADSRALVARSALGGPGCVAIVSASGRFANDRLHADRLAVAGD